MKAIHFGEHGLGEQIHQPHDLIFGPLPVLRGKRVDGQIAHPKIRRAANGLSHRLDAGLMALQAVQRTLFRPAPVAVHDDGHRLGDPLRIKRPRINPLGRIRKYVI